MDFNSEGYDNYFRELAIVEFEYFQNTKKGRLIKNLAEKELK